MTIKLNFMLSANAVITAQCSLALELKNIDEIIKDSPGRHNEYFVMQRGYVIEALEEFRALSRADAISQPDMVRDTFERDCV